MSQSLLRRPSVHPLLPHLLLFAQGASTPSTRGTEVSTTITPPARSNAQYMAALERANEIRAFRARLKKDVKAGKESAYGIVACPPEMTATMKVFDLLLAMPKTGRVRANKLLRRCSVSPSKTLAGLSDRQRRDLLALLPHRGSRPCAHDWRYEEDQRG